MSALSRIASKAAQVIKKNGVAATLSRVAIGSISAAGVVTPGGTTTSSTYGVFLPLTSYTDNRQELRTLALRKVRYLLISAKGMTLEPEPQDNVTIGSDTWQVESSTPIAPNGVAIAHQALVVKL